MRVRNIQVQESDKVWAEGPNQGAKLVQENVCQRTQEGSVCVLNRFQKISYFTPYVDSSNGYEKYAIQIIYVVFCAKYTFFEVFILLHQKMNVSHIIFGNSIPFLMNFCHILDILKLQTRKPIWTTFVDKFCIQPTISISRKHPKNRTGQ